MRPRPARRRVQPWAHRSAPSLEPVPRSWRWLRRSLFIALPILGLIGVGIGLLTQAKIDCLTTLHTFCSDQEVAALQAKYPHRLAILGANPAEDLLELQKSFPDWQELRVFLAWNGRSSVRLTRSESIATIRVGESTLEVLSNGQLRVGESSGILLQFESEAAWQAWLQSYTTPDDGLKALKALAHDLQTLRPRPTSAVVKSKDEVELRLENSSRAMLHLHSAAEVQQQLRTLQAVFTSSTMEQQPGEVDVRFKNVITR